MNRGYTLLSRKTWANTILGEPGRKYSRLEAWLYMTNVLAAGMDDEASGLNRGEFVLWRQSTPGELRTQPPELCLPPEPSCFRA